MSSVRPLRRSPLYDRLKAKGAVFGTKLNWERANYFLPPGVAEPPATLDTPGVAAARAGGAARMPRGRRRIRPDVVREIRAEGPRRARRAAAAVRERDGRRARAHRLHGDAERARRHRERPHGAAQSRRTSSSSSPVPAQATRDFAWIERHIACGRARGARRRYRRVVRAFGDGAESRAAACRSLSRDDFSRSAIPFSTVREVDVGYARVRAARMSYVGGPGFELYVPVEQCVTLYDALHEAGAGVRPARRGVLHDRRASHRSRAPRLGRRALAGRDAAGGRASGSR